MASARSSDQRRLLASGPRRELFRQRDSRCLFHRGEYDRREELALWLSVFSRGGANLPSLTNLGPQHDATARSIRGSSARSASATSEARAPYATGCARRGR